VNASSGPELLLIRHGETLWSRSGQHTSRTDLPLTDTGVAQARALRRCLVGRRVALALTSPLVRAKETARLAGLDHATIEPDLTEWDYGDFEGRTTAEIQQDSPGWSIWSGPWPNGETLDMVAARADRVVQRIRAGAAGGELAVAVAHGHMLRVLAARWLGAPPDTGRWLALDTGSVSELSWEHASPVIRHWNDVTHLDAA
jgi:broad specificity phosphatase PhoE